MIKIIKRGGVGMPAMARVDAQVVPVSLAAVHASCGRTGLPDPDDPIVRAKAEADRIIAEARSEADAIRKRAYDKGLKAKAEDSARALDELVSHLESEIAGVREYRAALVDQIEPEVLKLCVQAVEKILRHEIRTDPRVVERTIRACLRRVRDSEDVAIRVNPGDLEQVRALREDLMTVADGITSIEVAEDRRIGPGGCVVECGSGSLDARIETQLDTLRDRLTETLEHDRGDPGPDEVQRDSR